jgi:hypothetical protein
LSLASMLMIAFSICLAVVPCRWIVFRVVRVKWASLRAG